MFTSLKIESIQLTDGSLIFIGNELIAAGATPNFVFQEKNCIPHGEKKKENTTGEKENRAVANVNCNDNDYGCSYRERPFLTITPFKIITCNNISSLLL